MPSSRSIYSQIGPYSAIVDRPWMRLPDDARLALWIVPNIEYYQMLPPPGNFDAWSRCPHPDIMNYGVRDFGNRVGFWRLLEVLDRHKVRATLSLNIACYENFPQIMEACEQRQYDVMCHGMYNTDFLFDHSEEGERAYIVECQHSFRRLTGRDFTGWFSPVASATLATSDLVAEAGLRYTADFFHDDQPFPIQVRSGTLLSLPYSMDVNEGWNLRLNIEAEEFALSARDQFDRLYQEGAQIPRVMSLALHPYVFGQPHRIAHLDRLLGYMLAHEGVWQATGLEIADWFTTNCLPALTRSLADSTLRAPQGRA
jgi:peptidoglycan/xylan/chitin deacetylase (PgdA/CDA1 family)